MIIQVAILGYLCVAGYRAFNKNKPNNSPYQDDQTKKKLLDSKDGFYDKQMAQMYEGTNLSTEENISTKIAKKSFDETNDREIQSSAVATVLSTVGVFYPIFAMLSLPFILFSSKLVIKEAFELSKRGRVRVESIISVIIIGTLLLGQFFIASFATLLYKLSLKLTSAIIHNSKNQLTETYLQTPDTVWVLVDGVEVNIPFHDIQIGSIVVVHAGDIVPVDGVVQSGMASIDQHILTGESIPVEKVSGEEVYAMTVVLSGQLHIEVQKTGSESNAAKITQLLNKTADFKSVVQLQAEQLSNKLVMPIVGASCATLPLVGASGALGILACHPGNSLIGIAPITTLKHLSAASQQGILVKDGRTLELLNQVDTIVFDKTGTLTDEQPHVSKVHCFTKLSENEILRYAAAAEFKQSHPVAKAILDTAKQRNLQLPKPEHCEYKIGYGLVVNVENVQVRVGSTRFISTEGIAIPEELDSLQARSREKGYGLVMVAIDNLLAAAIELRPSLRPEAKAVVRQLKSRKNIKRIYIISGDAEIPTKELAKELEIDHYFAETLPQNKAAIIQQLQKEGRCICFVGDGINDSIALKSAQVSVSLAGASKLATDTAQVILMNRGIEHLNHLFDIAENLNKKMDWLFKLMLSPSLVGASSVLFWGAGITTVLYLCSAGMVASIAYVLLPLPSKLQHHRLQQD